MSAKVLDREMTFKAIPKISLKLAFDQEIMQESWKITTSLLLRYCALGHNVKILLNHGKKREGKYSTGL